MVFNIAQTVIGVLISTGILALGIGYIYAQFTKGKNERAKADIDTENSLNTYLRNQIDSFNKIVHEQNEKIVLLGNEIASLRAAIQEKDKTIDKYLAILQNRNPELETFMVSTQQALIEILKLLKK